MNQLKDNYQICTRCIMDTSDKFITFNSNGVCNHCKHYDESIKPKILDEETKYLNLQSTINNIKLSSHGKKYDCLIGVSGGADSTYVVYLAYKYGLRPLLLHFDNGWDSELAIKNIENMIEKTGFGYYNYIVDWEEFKDLQRSYLKASVVDIEIPSDLAIHALIPLFQLKLNIKYHLWGLNIETESTMGKDWNYSKNDRSNLLGIHKEFGTLPLSTFPNLTSWKYFLYHYIKKYQSINILSYAECNYDIIKRVLREKFGWRDYGVKHGESIFTKFYQSYILTNKFGFDKRRAHLSDRINSGQINREFALEILSKPPYDSEDDQETEKNYFLSKLGITDTEFIEIMNSPIKSHYDYPVNGEVGNVFERLLRKLFRVYLNKNQSSKSYE